MCAEASFKKTFWQEKQNCQVTRFRRYTVFSFIPLNVILTAEYYVFRMFFTEQYYLLLLTHYIEKKGVKKGEGLKKSISFLKSLSN